MIGADAPLLVYRSAHDHALLQVARQAGWRVERAEALDVGYCDKRRGLRCIH